MWLRVEALGLYALGVGVIVAAVVGRSPLGILNFLVLQWFGVRLVAPLPRAVMRMPEGWTEYTLRRRIAELQAEQPALKIREVPASELATEPDGWHLLRWVWPLTGWWSAYRYIYRPAP